MSILLLVSISISTRLSAVGAGGGAPCFMLAASSLLGGRRRDACDGDPVRRGPRGMCKSARNKKAGVGRYNVYIYMHKHLYVF